MPRRKHKGGRTEQVNARLTPDERDALIEMLTRYNVSLADWIVAMMHRYTQAEADAPRLSEGRMEAKIQGEAIIAE